MHVERFWMIIVALGVELCNVFVIFNIFKVASLLNLMHKA